MKKLFRGIRYLACFLVFLGMATLVSIYHDNWKESQERYREVVLENEMLKQVLRGEFKQGKDVCSSLELLIECYDEVNFLRNPSSLN